MFPVQMQHPRAVLPQSANFGLFVTPSGHERFPGDHQYTPTVFPANQRSFPIRASQIRRWTPASIDMVGPTDLEHHLRRKTPRGTIDAGYDGSHTQISQGPPPLKHIIMPGPSASMNHYRQGIATPGPLSYVQEGRSSLGNLGFQSNPEHPNIDSIPWTFAADCVPPIGSQQILAQSPLHSGRTYQSSAQHDYLGTHPNIYQPAIRANEYNVRAFCPPPVAVNDSFSPGPMSLHHPPTRNYSSSYRHEEACRGTLGHGFNPMLCNSRSKAVIDPLFEIPVNPNVSFPPAQPSQIHFENLSIDSGSSPKPQFQTQLPDYTSHLRFREKALAQAYKSYLDLLAYLQAIKKTSLTKGSSGSRSSPRLLVYPKPPKPAIPASFLFERDGSKDYSKQGHGIHDSQVSLASYDTNGTARCNGLNCEDRQNFLNMKKLDESVPNMREDTPRQQLYDARLFGGRHAHGPHQSAGSQIMNAKTSLAILSSLCEQSGWKWIDGVLLGGCLQYGLERYEEALEWFSKITSLDPSHVEAITNIAATLYCLNRQDEAERNWLIAVKVRPGYLEAVEHLVGLLYKKRSREAIEIIEFVQQSLKIRPREPSHRSSTGILNSEINHMNIRNGKTGASTYSLFADLDQVQALAGPIQREDTTSPGFGSSGYAVPGKENGRILALIHAKGTMLYSLKEIGRASNAFEEAVLISTGRSMNDIQHLVHRIQSVLSPVEMSSNVGQSVSRQLRPLLLPPERARSTAQLVFGGTGELPGLHFVVDGTSKRAAVQTTSNSLLSLAKILQDAMSGGIVMPSLLRSPSGVGDILALYYLSISLQESPSTANNVGILLAGVQQGVSTGLSAGPEAGPSSGLPGIAPGSGLALALAYYHYGLRLDPKHVHLHTNLGSLLKDIGQLDLAIQMYEQAVSCDGTFDIALTNLANAVKDRGRINDAIMYYKRAVGSNPEFAEAVCGLFTALNSVCDWRGRGGVVLQSAKYDRWHVDENGLLIDAQSVGHGSGLAQRVVRIVKRQLEEASSWGMGILTDAYIALLADHVRHLWPSTSNDLETLLRSWAGKPWEGSRLMRLIERVNRIIQWRWYREQHFDITGSSSNYARLRLHPNLTMPSAPTVLPFHTFTCPLTARDIRVISQRNAVRISCSTLKLPWLPTTVYPPPNPPSPHLNVGYVSSDFNNHPLAHLMQSVFGMHDSRRVRAVCYATSPSDKSAHRQKIEREAPVFRDVSNWTSEKLVDQIIQDGIHILVNLNGYTRGARNEIFAARPAPVQMSFMGFAGTLGAEWCDYILADTMAIPQETLRPRRSNIGVEDLFREEAEGDGDDWMYSENIVYCRDTFFCCDHAQSCDPAERKVSWEEEQRRRWTMRKELFPTMPDDVVILGNFNQLYKIEPTTFRSWLRILAQVPKAVLWLLRFPELGETNLRRTAKAWAGTEVASRLIFTDVAPKNQHISRARVCDLFLDTPECNAHTTAADVLWSSTPLLTLPRYPYKMCSRMAASILKGALPKSADGRRAASDLIAENEVQYERSAIRLAGGLCYNITQGGYGEGTGRLTELRKLLWDSRWQCGLFDTRRWVDDVESAYEQAWQRWVAGQGGDIYL